MKKLKNMLISFNVIGVLLMLTLFVLQCRPFWRVGGVENSIQGFVWFPGSEKAILLINHIGEARGNLFMVDEILYMPLIVLGCAVIGTVVLFKYAESPVSAIAPIICSISGLVAYLVHPVFRLGARWEFHSVICALMLLVALISIAISLIILLVQTLKQENFGE